MRWLIHPEKPVTGLALVGHFLLVALLLYWSAHFLTVRIVALGFESNFLHRVHTVFHEAGHILLLWAPPVGMALGGSIGQVAAPLALGLAFLIRNRDGFAAAVCLWWAGQSVVDVAPYINDARMLQLQLLGGGTGAEVEGHDWAFILGAWGLLDRDIYIARAVMATGRAMMVLALLWSAACLVCQVAVWRREWRADGDPNKPGV